MKLKQIPKNTVVHTPTEEEAKELLAILTENRHDVTATLRVIKETNNYKDEEICFRINGKSWGHCTKEWYQEEGYTILTLADFKHLYCEHEKPQSKFKVGDKVKIVNVRNPMMLNEIGIIEEHSTKNSSLYKVKWCEDSSTFIEDVYLEPYTEPETKPTEDMDAKENRNLSQDVANCDKSESKELNLCELLRECEEGKRFYSLLYGETQLRKVGHECIEIATIGGKYWTSISRDGTFADGGNVVLFPSRALYEQYPLDPYAAWMKWQEEKQFHILRIILTAPDIERDYVEVDFRTPADRYKCLEEIKAIIEKYSK